MTALRDRERPDRLQATGERIGALLSASASGGAVARDRAEELVRLTADLYGAGIERILEILCEAGRLDEAVTASFAGDELVSSLLLVHGLHPYDVGLRVARALDAVRPYLGSHGGDVQLLEVTQDGVVRLRLLGTCDGCPSSSVTVKLAVMGAIEAAAPEVVHIEVEEAAAAGASGLVPVDSVRSRLDALGSPGVRWEPVPELTSLPTGSMCSVEVAGLEVVVCRIGLDLLAYQDRCPRCRSPIRGAVLSRRLGATIGEAVLTCPTCGAQYDARRAGACLNEPSLHLNPVPLLTQGGLSSVAVPAPGITGTR